MVQKVVVIGLGSYGSSVAKLMTDNPDNELIGFTRTPKKSIDKYSLFNFEVNSLDNLSLIDDPESYFKNSIIFIGLPTSAIESFFNDYNSVISKLPDNCLIVNLSKGVVNNKLSYSYIESELIKITNKSLSRTNFLSLLGPSFSIDMDSGVVGLTISSWTMESNRRVQSLFKNSSKVEFDHCLDPISTAEASVLKNIYSIVTGFINSRVNDSTYHLILTKIIKEFFNNTYKGSMMENLKFSTIGDLLLTSSSNKSRNRVLGEMISNGIYDPKNPNSGIIYEGLKSIKLYANDKYPIILQLDKMINEELTKDEYLEFLLRTC